MWIDANFVELSRTFQDSNIICCPVSTTRYKHMLPSSALYIVIGARQFLVLLQQALDWATPQPNLSFLMFPFPLFHSLSFPPLLLDFLSVIVISVFPTLSIHF